MNCSVESISKCEELIAEHANTNIDIYDGEITEVNFDSYPGSSMFKSRTSDVVSEGPNFAGHFALATWGCGTSCFGFSLVDIKTGEIINFEPVHENFHLRDFSVNQNYIVIDPVYAGRERSYYLLLENDGKYTFEKTCTEISDEDLFP